MRKFICIYFLTVLLLLFPSINSAADEILLEKYEEDVTGNGIKEVIQLYGTLLSPESKFYHDIQVQFHSESKQVWKVSHGGGYDPKLEFIDLTHDGVSDILFQNAKDMNGEIHHSSLYTIKQRKQTEIELPVQWVSGHLSDDFQAELNLTQNSKPIQLDLKSYTERYIQMGLYNKEGKLLKDMPLMIESIAFFEPVLISNSKGYGLKSYQPVNGAHHSDRLGTIETLWYYEDDNWIILQSNWKRTTED